MTAGTDGDRSLLKLGDRTGCLRATAQPEAAAACCEPGSVVHVTGRYAGGELEIRAVRAATDAEYDLAELLDGPPRSATGMESDLRELLATVQDPHLRALLDAVFGPAPRPGGTSATRRRPSATTRPTGTGCSSTR